MKFNSKAKKSSKKRTVLLLSLLAAVLVVGVAVALYIQSQNNNNQNKQQPSESSKQDLIDKDKDGVSVPSEGLPANTTDTTSEDIPIDNSLSVEISSVSQTGGMVNAVAAVTSNGTCVFLFQPADGGKPVTQQVNVANKKCSTKISQNEFSYLGNWKLTVTYYNNGNRAEAIKNVTIN